MLYPASLSGGREKDVVSSDEGSGAFKTLLRSTNFDVEQVCDTYNRLKIESIWHGKIVYMPCSVEFCRTLPRIATKSVDT